LLCTALLVPAGVAAAQDTANTGAQSAPVKKRKFRHPGSFVTEYDKKGDFTRVMLRRIPLYGDISRRFLVIELTAYFHYKGTTLARPDVVTLGFVSFADEQRFVDFHDLTVKLDGEVVKLGQTELVESKNVGSGARQYREIMRIDVPYETFLKIVNAKKVGVELGRVRFDTDEKHREALRDLASRAEP
jgi:hypothetical protein